MMCPQCKEDLCKVDFLYFDSDEKFDFSRPKEICYDCAMKNVRVSMKGDSVEKRAIGCIGPDDWEDKKEEIVDLSFSIMRFCSERAGPPEIVSALCHALSVLLATSCCELDDDGTDHILGKIGWVINKNCLMMIEDIRQSIGKDENTERKA